MPGYRRYAATFIGTIALLLIARTDAAAVEDLERIFVGVPNQLTLPPALPPSSGGGHCMPEDRKGPSELETSKRPDGLCSSQTSKAAATENESVSKLNEEDSGESAAAMAVAPAKPLP